VGQHAEQTGFTLIEIIAVVAVVLVLGLIIVVRVGNLRSSAYDTSARVLEKEFSKGVEQLVSSGANIIEPLLLRASAGTLVSQIPADPIYMGMESTVYRLSSPATVNAGAVSETLRQLENLLIANGFGRVQGSVSQEMLSRYDVDLVVVKDAGGTSTGVFLKLSNP